MFFIAEIGSNWIGNVEVAKETIRAIKRTGVNCVKFQMWRQEDLYPDKPELKKYELNFDQAREIKNFCHRQGMIFLCSPFYPEAVDFLEEIRVSMYKIASRTTAEKDPYSGLTMEKVRETEKPIIQSFGMGWPDGVNHFIGRFVTKLYCKSDYPAKLDDYNRFKTYGYDGISDHTKGITLPLIYAQKNPNLIIEKHVKFVDNKSPDAPFSITTQELQDFMILSKSFPLKFG